MKQYFECKIKYNIILEDGRKKLVTEKYLVDAMSFTEAEANITKEMTPYISGEFIIDDISRANYSELFLVEGEKYYDAKLAFITLDEKSGKENKSTVNNVKILLFTSAHTTSVRIIPSAVVCNRNTTHLVTERRMTKLCLSSEKVCNASTFLSIAIVTAETITFPGKKSFGKTRTDIQGWSGEL